MKQSISYTDKWFNIFFFGNIFVYNLQSINFFIHFDVHKCIVDMIEIDMRRAVPEEENAGDEFVGSVGL